MEAELCGHPREGQEHDHGSHDEPQRITGSARRERHACAPSGRDRQTESQDDPERRKRVDPARVQVVLVDRERHDRAEADRRPCDQPCLGRQGGDGQQSQGHGDEGNREVEEHQRPAEAAREPLVRHVVELGRVEPAVRDQHRQADGAPQCPRPQRLALARVRPHRAARSAPATCCWSPSSRRA